MQLGRLSNAAVDGLDESGEQLVVLAATSAARPSVAAVDGLDESGKQRVVLATTSARTSLFYAGEPAALDHLGQQRVHLGGDVVHRGRGPKGEQQKKDVCVRRCGEEEEIRGMVWFSIVLYSGPLLHSYK
jgi:hypothetical protein